MTTDRHPGIFFILVAPAGAGKNRLIQSVVERVDGLRQLPTATTRPIRPGEQQGREHIFVTQEEFDRYKEMGALLEYQLVHGVHWYGILREKVESALYGGELVIGDIEVNGARAALEAYPDNTVTIFVQPPSIESLVERMRARNEKETEIARRLLRVPMELDYAAEADYVVVNDDLEYAAEHLKAIITAERSRPIRRIDKAHFNYDYAAQVVPLCGDEALRRDSLPVFPETVINDTEPPHVAAARALNMAFGSALPAGEWVYGGAAEDDFLPPVAVQTSSSERGEKITFVYQYRMAERLDPPKGWAWKPLSNGAIRVSG